MKISIALATYNGERFLKQQLDSLRQQTLLPTEVVIIDDCSTDNTADFVDSYIKQNGLSWSFTVATQNSGYRRNFYNCLKQCTGDIIFLCDQDDIWYPQKLEVIVKRFEENEDCLAVNTSFDMVDKDGLRLDDFRKDGCSTSNNGLILYKVEKGAFQRVTLDTVLMYNVSPGCTCAFKRSVVEEYLSTSVCDMPHDWELNVIAAKGNGLYFLNEALIGYRLHGGNAIGLSDGKQDHSLKMRGTDNNRIEMFKVQQAQSKLINQYIEYCSEKTITFAVALERFCKNRERILYKYKLFPCISNLFVYCKVKIVSTIQFRGLIGDFVYVIKNKISSGRKK